jgi:ribonuclease P protein component
MDRKFRLTNSSDFKRVRHTGQSFAHPFVLLIVSTNQLDHVRIGFTAGKLVGNAVQRNRAKRRMREVFRLLLPQVSPGWDVIAIAKPAILSASWDELQSAISSKLVQAGLIDAG